VWRAPAARRLKDKFLNTRCRADVMSSDMSKCLATLGATLQDSIGKRVLVKLRDGYEIRGILKSFDQHVNLLLEDAEEVIDNNIVLKRGTVVVRGENVLFVSPT
jgi:Small nuclear ribonucleoprotein, LSM family